MCDPDTLRSCKTCFYRRGDGDFAKCDLGGVFCATERQHTDRCGKNYENWKQRPLEGWEKFKDNFWKWLNSGVDNEKETV